MDERRDAIMPVDDESWDVVLEDGKLGGEGPMMSRVLMTYQYVGVDSEESCIGFIIPTDVGVAVAPNYPDCLWEATSDEASALRLLGERLEELGLI